MMMPTFFLVLLVLCSVTTVTGNQRKIFKLAKCFNNTTSVAEAKTCLGGVSTCFADDTTVETVKACIQEGVANLKANFTASKDNSRFLQDTTDGDDETGGEGFGKGGFRPAKGSGVGRNRKRAGVIRSCLEPQRECIMEEVRAFIKKLPECINTTAVAFGTCYRDNANSCSATCSSADIPASNPFQGADRAVIKTCSGFQNQVIDPSCQIVDCCPQCQAEYVALMSCVGQELVKLKPEPCELTCPTTRRRNLAERYYVSRKLAAKKPNPVIVAEECAIYLDTKEETITEDAIASKILEGEFVGCVADIAILVAEEQVEFAGDSGIGGSSPANRTPMAIAGLLSAFLGLVSLM